MKRKTQIAIATGLVSTASAVAVIVQLAPVFTPTVYVPWSVLAAWLGFLGGKFVARKLAIETVVVSHEVNEKVVDESKPNFDPLDEDENDWKRAPESEL